MVFDDDRFTGIFTAVQTFSLHNLRYFCRAVICAILYNGDSGCYQKNRRMRQGRAGSPNIQFFLFINASAWGWRCLQVRAAIQWQAC